MTTLLSLQKDLWLEKFVKYMESTDSIMTGWDLWYTQIQKAPMLDSTRQYIITVVANELEKNYL